MYLCLYIYIYICFYLSIYDVFIDLSIRLCFYLSTYPSIHRSINLYIYDLLYLNLYLSKLYRIQTYIYIPSIHPSTHLLIYLPICMYQYFFCVSIYLSLTQRVAELQTPKGAWFWSISGARARGANPRKKFKCFLRSIHPSKGCEERVLLHALPSSKFPVGLADTHGPHEVFERGRKTHVFGPWGHDLGGSVLEAPPEGNLALPSICV